MLILTYVLALVMVLTHLLTLDTIEKEDTILGIIIVVLAPISLPLILLAVLYVSFRSMMNNTRL